MTISVRHYTTVSRPRSTSSGQALRDWYRRAQMAGLFEQVLSVDVNIKLGH
jgi:hypothetical protein